ncbi:MAG: glycogen synthase [Firmicutes bacterium]|nr:glycogen synthase [Bacillota bacterium]
MCDKEPSVTIMTSEYPPYIYGGAGVHVDYLSRFLAKTIEVEVRCFGKDRPEREGIRVRAYERWDLMNETENERFAKVLSPLSVNLAMVREPIVSDIIHSHTWYTFVAGVYGKQLYDKPLVTTAHSLEPLRPWKQEQLGNAYRLSYWMEKAGIDASDCIIAVSGGMKEDILNCYGVSEQKVRVIHNGIDPVEYKYVRSDIALQEYGIWENYILFVGRISKQKGIFHLLNAVPYLPNDVQIVICGGAADTEEIEREVVYEAAKWRNVKLIRGMVPKDRIIELYSHARVFCCPSMYEPFGIINLEAMACETPVVGSAVGGIKEIVIHNETGFLVTPGEPEELAYALSRLLYDKELADEMGKSGRRRVENLFSWDSIAEQTVQLYKELIGVRM